jgi:hypothetical protein
MVTKKGKKGKLFRKREIGQKKCPKSDFPKKSWIKFSLLYNKLANLLKEFSLFWEKGVKNKKDKWFNLLKEPIHFLNVDLHIFHGGN